MRSLIWVLAFGFVALSVSQVAADTGGALVVSTCGTLTKAYDVGSTRSLTVNTDGETCS